MFAWQIWGITPQRELSLQTYHWTFRAISVLANAAAMARFACYTGDEQRDDTERELPPWAKPNQWQRGSEFWSQVMVLCTVFGGAAIWKRAANGQHWTPGVPPTIIEAHPICNVQTVVTNRNQLTGYKLSAYGDTFDLATNELILIPELVVDNPLKPTGPGQTLLGTVALAAAADAWAQGFFANGAVPSIVMLLREKITDAQRQSYRKELEDQHSGIRRAGRPMVLSGVESVQIPNTVKDRDFSGLVDTVRDTVAGVMGVPKILMGETDGYNRATATVAEATMWRHDVLPRLNKWAAIITDDLLTWGSAASGLTASFDVSEVPALGQERIDQTEVGRHWWDMGLPLDLVSERLGLGLPHAEGTDLPWGGRDMAGAVESSAPSTSSEPKAKPTAEDDEDVDVPESDDVERGARGGLAVRSAPKGYVTGWERQVRTPTERAINDTLSAHFFEVRKDVIAALDEISSERGPGITMAKAAKLWAKQAQWDEKLVKRLIPEWFRGASRALAFLRQSIGDHKILDPYSNESIRAAMEAKGIKVTKINRTTRDDLRATIAAGLEKDETVEQIAKRVRKVMNTTKGRARTIAITETAQSTHIATMTAYSALGIKRHQWVAEQDSRTRDSHDRVDGQVRRVGAKFTNGLLMPGDPSGPAHEIINCRCTTVAVQEDEN